MSAKPPETDVLVMGWTHAGAVSATALARAGYSVVVADVETPLHPTAEQQVPAVAPIRRLLDLLGLPGLSRRRARGDPREPVLQIVLPEGRLDLTRDADHNRRELRRELGSADLWDDLHRLGTDQDQRLAHWMHSAPPADDTAALDPWHTLREPLERRLHRRGATRLLHAHAPQPSVAARDVDASSALRLWWRALQPMGPSLSNLTSALRHSFDSAGGSWITPTQDYRLQSRFGRPTGLRDSQSRLRFQVLLWCLPPAALLDRLDTRLFGRGLRKRLAAGRPRSHRLEIHVGLRRAGLPEAMGPAVALAAPHSKSWAPLWIGRGNPDPDGEPVLTLMAEAPGAADPRRLRTLRDQSLDRLRALLPFLDEHLRWTWCPQLPDACRGPAVPTDLVTQSTPVLDLPALTDPHAPLGGLPLAPGTSRMLLASNRTYPRLGVEGELLAGWHAATTAQSLLPG